MADELYALSSDDVAILKQMLAWYKRQPKNAPIVTLPEELPSTQDVYVARVPLAGIPAMQDRQHLGQEDRPGSAMCVIYKIVYNDDVGAYVLENTNRSRLVYNISEINIQSKYCRIERDKFGRWLADAYRERTRTGTGTGTGSDLCSSTNQINGVSLDALAVSSTPDYVLTIEGGCLVKTTLGSC